MRTIVCTLSLVGAMLVALSVSDAMRCPRTLSPRQLDSTRAGVTITHQCAIKANMITPNHWERSKHC